MKKILSLFFFFLVAFLFLLSLPKNANALDCVNGTTGQPFTCSNSVCSGCTMCSSRCGNSGCFFDVGCHLSNTCGAGCVPTATPVPTTPPAQCDNANCPYCTFCSSPTGSCIPYTNGCIGGATPTPMPAGSCPAGQNNPWTQCQTTIDGGNTSYACISNAVGCGTNQCGNAADCGWMCPVTCTPTTSCSAQGATCGSINNGCSVVSCGTCSTGFTCSGNTCVPVSFTVSGNVFVDQNKDSLQNGGDPNYTGAITIDPNPPGATVTYPSAGNYVINNMPAGQYTISYTSLPAGYQMTNPVNGPPPSFSITVGPGCDVTGSNSAACDANGNVTGLRYGITNSTPWIQSTSGDITGTNVTNPSGGGITNPIPSGASCGPYTSLTGSGGTPGVIYAGASSYDFGAGQASQNPYNWVVGGLAYPDTYIPTTPGLIKTSYSYMLSQASQSNLTPVNIATYCGGGGIASCTLSTTLPNGLYISNGDLTLTGASYTFPANRNFVILVSGKLNIQTEVHVPIGSTAFFTASGDITVASSVGESVVSSIRSNVEGYYSTDGSFYVQGGSTCPTADKRLNVAGSIIVNAALKGGSFVNQRDLCAGNVQCPAFMIIERPDFVLNSPEFLKSPRRIWQEIAP